MGSMSPGKRSLKKAAVKSAIGSAILEDMDGLDQAPDSPDQFARMQVRSDLFKLITMTSEGLLKSAQTGIRTTGRLHSSLRLIRFKEKQILLKFASLDNPGLDGTQKSALEKPAPVDSLASVLPAVFPELKVSDIILRFNKSEDWLDLLIKDVLSFFEKSFPLIQYSVVT